MGAGDGGIGNSSLANASVDAGDGGDGFTSIESLWIGSADGVVTRSLDVEFPFSSLVMWLVSGI